MKPENFFKSPEHKSRFLSAMQQHGKIYDGKLDPEYSAALLILTADAEIWQRTNSYVSRRGIDFEEMLKEVDFGSGHGVLVRLAGNLFNGVQQVNPVNIAAELDEDNFELALHAIQLRRYGLGLAPKDNK